MSFETIQRKKELLNELMEALATVERVLPHLSPDERLAVFEGVKSLLDDIAAQHETMKAAVTLFSIGTSIAARDAEPKPAPARAVELLLQKSPTGLFANDIVKALEGKIQTSSQKPRDVIYSAIAFLKGKGTITQMADKRYIITKKEDTTAAEEPMAF